MTGFDQYAGLLCLASLSPSPKGIALAFSFVVRYNFASEMFTLVLDSLALNSTCSIIERLCHCMRTFHVLGDLQH